MLQSVGMQMFCPSSCHERVIVIPVLSVAHPPAGHGCGVHPISFIIHGHHDLACPDTLSISAAVNVTILHAEGARPEFIQVYRDVPLLATSELSDPNNPGAILHPQLDIPDCPAESPRQELFELMNDESVGRATEAVANVEAVDGDSDLNVKVMVGSGRVVGEVQDAGLRVLVDAIAEYFNGFFEAFHGVGLAHVEETIDDLQGSFLPVGSHAAEREHTRRGGGVGDDGETIRGSE